MENQTWAAAPRRNRFHQSVASRVHVVVACLLSEASEGTDGSSQAFTVMRRLAEGRVISRNQAMLMRTATLAGSYLSRAAPGAGWYPLGILVKQETGGVVIGPLGEASFSGGGVGLLWRAGEGARFNGAPVAVGAALVDQISTAAHERGLRTEARAATTQKLARQLHEVPSPDTYARLVYPATPMRTLSWKVES